MTPLDMQIADFQQPPVLAETIEFYQYRILEIIASLEQRGIRPEYIINGSPVAKEIAHFYTKIGDLLEDADKAAACYETALQLDPRQWSARKGLLRKPANKDEIAKAFLIDRLIENPRDTGLLNQLGNLHYKLQEHARALECYRQAGNFYGLASAWQGLGDIKAARASYVRAAKLQPLVKSRANKAVPDFSMLAIFAPFVGNTPTAYLTENTSFETNHFTFLAGAEPDINMLRSSGQVLINIVSEADQAHAVLPQIAQLVDRLGLPVINHPSKIQNTTREGIAHLLRDIPDCRVAQVVRHVAGESITAKALQKKISFDMPLLARPAGTHGGERFEKIDSPEELESFIRQDSAVDHYLMEYINYQSDDGYFRKYRFIFVDGQIMPYHLAIGDNWKVHHGTTDMARHQWMQDEEKAFLEKPETVFTPKNYQALRAIQQAVGLEYFGIDCGRDLSGNLVVFEANASMLVHQHNEAFPYKTPFARNIKQAFCEMLKKRVENHRIKAFPSDVRRIGRL